MTRPSLSEKALAFTLGLFLLTILYRGGNVRSLVIGTALAALLCIAACAVIAWKAYSNAIASLPSGSGFYIAAMVCLMASGLAALVPLSPETWLALPGREAYREVVATLQQRPIGMSVLQLSIDPVGTSYATLSLLVAFSVGMIAMLLPTSLLMSVLGLFVVMAIAQAILGILQVALGTPSFMGFDLAIGNHRASGTFVNKNHYATLLAMSLPLLIFRVSGQIRFSSRTVERSSLSNVWWGVATALVATALVASLSRAGSAAGFSVAVLATLLCVLRKQTTVKQRFGLLAIASLAFVLAAESSLTLLLDSLKGPTLANSAEGRQSLVRLSILGVKAFFPLGSGLGSYPIAFQRFQAEGVVGFVEHVHNDYVELIFETGLFGAVVLMCFAAAAVLSAWRFWQSHSADRPLSPAIACWLGAMAFAIHALFDFPAHIPGLTIVVSLLFGASMNGNFLKSSEASPLARRNSEKTATA